MPVVAVRIEAGGKSDALVPILTVTRIKKNDLTVFWAPKQHWNDMPPADLINVISGTRIAKAIYSICN